MSNKTIGYGSFIEFAIKEILKNNSNYDIEDSEIKDKERQIDFTVTATGFDKKPTSIGVQVVHYNQINIAGAYDDGEKERLLSYRDNFELKKRKFFNSRWEILQNVNKALYIEIDLTITDGDERPHKELLRYVMKNIEAAIDHTINSKKTISTYRVSIYKIEETEFLPDIPSVPVLALPDIDNNNLLTGYIIRRGGRNASGLSNPIIVREESGDTLIGFMREPYMARDDISEVLGLLANSDADERNNLSEPVKVRFRRRSNDKFPEKGDIALIYSLEG